MHRPAILSAKMERQQRITCDADRLKAAAKSDRPGEATLDAVRGAYADAMEELADAGGSVAAVESVALPSDRLNGGSA
jgi:hypothetical protein